MANAPRVSAPSPSSALNAVSAASKAVPKKCMHKPKNCKNKEVAKKASSQADDEYESKSKNDQPDNEDDNASVSGSEESVSEMILQTAKAAKAAKKNKLKAKAEEKYCLAAKELVYDMFMLSHQELEPQQGALQDSHLAALNVIHQREEELVANLQSSSNCLADNTRDAYRIIFKDYKKFCNDNYSSKTFKHYEVNPCKALAYLQYLELWKPLTLPITWMQKRLLEECVLRCCGLKVVLAFAGADQVAVGSSTWSGGGDIPGATISFGYASSLRASIKISKIEHGYAALNTLQKLQQAQSTEPNTAQPLAMYKIIEDSMKGYAKSLVGGILHPEHVERNEKGELTHSGQDVSTNSNTINYYTVAEHIRCLLYTWHQPINGHSIMIREHFVLVLNNEPWPDMENPEWTAVKVLGQGKKVAMVYTTAQDATLSVFNSQNVSCTNITNSGCHSGAKEAVRLKVVEEDIWTGGHWVHGTGKMHQVYLDKQPITFALAMAGFSTKPFHLWQNEVTPSLELQCLIFLFIKEVLGTPNSSENNQWRIECDQEMKEFDPNNNDNLDNIEPYAFKPNPSCLKMNKATTLAQCSNKKHVLQLMLQLCQVLLQDAAKYLH
ncbi:MAG: hypothetical protein BYD32DRAFT_461698 [Podila humilis]|nr:MAG: hypothetical protein BYD32DRAFT_461698 [Podila humilis]